MTARLAPPRTGRFDIRRPRRLVFFLPVGYVTTITDGSVLIRVVLGLTPGHARRRAGRLARGHPVRYRTVWLVSAAIINR